MVMEIVLKASVTVILVTQDGTVYKVSTCDQEATRGFGPWRFQTISALRNCQETGCIAEVAICVAL